MRTLSERIKKERVTWGMTQEELAEVAGLSRDQIAKIETGRREVGVEEIARFATAFQMSTDELLRGPQETVYHRFEAGRAETDKARAWLDQCIDNSLFVRRIAAAGGR